MNLTEQFNYTGSTVLQFGTTGDGGAMVAYEPTSGVSVINIVAILKMANAADCTLTVKTADDAAGTNPVALTVDVPIWLDGDRIATDAKAVTQTAATGTFVYTFQIPASIVPDGKFIGIYSDAGNANNIYTAFAVEDTYYKG